jgi:hypothetical protein
VRPRRSGRRILQRARLKDASHKASRCRVSVVEGFTQYLEFRLRIGRIAILIPVGSRSDAFGSITVLQRPLMLRTRCAEVSVHRFAAGRVIRRRSEMLAGNDRCWTNSRPEGGCLPNFSRACSASSSNSELLAGEIQAGRERNCETAMLGTSSLKAEREQRPAGKETGATYLPPKVKPPMNGLSQTTSMELALTPITTPFMDR